MVDLNSTGYLLGIVAVIGTLIYGAFFGEAGKDLYGWIKHKIRPPAPEPVEVSSSFRPENHSPELFLWVKEIDVSARLSAGYSYYRDPEDGAKRFMVPNPSRAHPGKSFYMWKPGKDQSKDRG